MGSRESQISTSQESFHRGQRLQFIFDFLAKDQPVHDASEAHVMVHNAFDTIERKYAVGPRNKYPMRVSSFVGMPEMRYGERLVRYDSYLKHLLFLGDNGAIEIRTNEHRIAPKLHTHPYAELPVVFAKAGADGRGVWDPITS